jgi:hypothetical protein
MNNFRYSNIEEILATKSFIRGNRFREQNLRRKLVVPILNATTAVEDPTSIELHVFLENGTYIEGGSLYDIPFVIETREETFLVDGERRVYDRKYAIVDVHKHLHENLKLPTGKYKIVYNFMNSLVGGPSNAPNRVFISDISPDRKELRLAIKQLENESAKQELTKFVLDYLKDSYYMPPIVLNFGENMIVDVINVATDGDANFFYVKLYDPLPREIDLYYECWVGRQTLKPWIDTVDILTQEEEKGIPFIKGPNFEVNYDYWLSTETDYKSWNDLLSTNVQTSQEILNRYVLNSGSSVNLNIDFREFENFVFYSSAEERVENFFYKIGLVENYNTQLSLLNTYTGSVEANVTKLKGLKDKLISGFDNFEKWLYYETTSSNYYSSQTSSSITPYPKYELDITASNYDISTKEGKYNLYSILSNEVQTWYENLIVSASNYDLKNYNALNKAIPEYIRDDGQSEQFTTFVNMVGHHFDVMYLYTDHILRKNERKENPKDGLSQDLIYDATRNLGWTLTHGTQAKDLWEYALGVSGSGEAIWTGKTITNKYLTKTDEERTKEVWRRILNTLPYVYKTKGTSRAIKALLSAYGIPQTLLTIREFGGPDNADFGDKPKFEWEKHTYYLNFSGSYPLPTHNHYVSVPWEKVNNENSQWQYPDTVTFRWRMEPDRLYEYVLDPIQTILQKQSGSRVDWFVTANKNGTDIEKGTLTFYLSDGSTYKSASIIDEYLYDDIPLNIMIRRYSSNDTISSNQTYDFILKTSKYGKIAVERSASISINGSTESLFNRAWSSNGTLFIGSGSNFETNKILSGSIFELRYWTNQLKDESFDNHVLSARAYNGNTQTSSFYDLQGQWKFWQKFDIAATTSLASSHPDQSKNTFYSSSKVANFIGFNSGAFESIVENYNMEVISVGNNTPFSEKVRIESASLQAPLKMDESSAVSQFDKFSIDSNKLMVAFSPQHIINEDIYEALGYTNLDDYIGDYYSSNLSEYPDLKQLSNEYWKKYPNKNDFTAYVRLISIFDFSVFDQIRQTLPLRVNEILGLVIEPNVLERSKVKLNRDFSAENFQSIDTNDVSKTPTPSVSLNKNKTTLMIGFDENFGSNFAEISTDYEVESTFVTEIDEAEGEGNIGIGVKTKLHNKKTKIDTPIKKVYGKYKKPLQTFLQSGIKNIIPMMKTLETTISATKAKFSTGQIWFTPSPISNQNVSVTGQILPGGISILPKSSNYILIENKTPIGYNSIEKKTAHFEQIENQREDGFYKTFSPIYSTYESYAKDEPTSYLFISSSHMNSEKLPTGIKNHRFLGTKLAGKNGEGINQPAIPAVTPDGGPVVIVLTSKLEEDVVYKVE